MLVFFFIFIFSGTSLEFHSLMIMFSDNSDFQLLEVLSGTCNILTKFSVCASKSSTGS